MASSLAIADKRAKADLRLAKAAEAAASVFGVQLNLSKLPRQRFPELHAAETTEAVADFLEQLVKQKDKQ